MIKKIMKCRILKLKPDIHSEKNEIINILVAQYYQ